MACEFPKHPLRLAFNYCPKSDSRNYVMQACLLIMKDLVTLCDCWMVVICDIQCRHALIYDLGSAKLADFGLSKTLPVNKHATFDLDDKFELTGETGSYRFMAREVFVHEAYNNKVRPCM